jgi:hypothetical protein
MSESRFDVPLADLAEQARGLDEDQAPAEGEPLPPAEPHPSLEAADEADVLEQSMDVSDQEDYPYGADEE